MRELILTWKGEEYRCKVTHETIMHIEDKVILTQLAQRFAEGASEGHIPTSHIAWLYYCLLRSGGALVQQEEVWNLVKTNKTDPDTLNRVVSFLIEEVFGVVPDDMIEDENAKKPDGVTTDG